MKLIKVMITSLIGTAIRLNIDKTVNTFAGVSLSFPYSAAYTAKITIEEKIGNMFISTSTYVLIINVLRLS